MATAAQLRRLALALPETEEKEHFGQPDFRVRGKIFADVAPDGTFCTLKLTGELQALVLDAKPKVFSPAAGYWGRMGWTRARLQPLALGELASLVEEAWRLIAPKRLAQQQEAKPRRSQARRARPARKRARA